MGLNSDILNQLRNGNTLKGIYGYVVWDWENEDHVRIGKEHYLPIELYDDLLINIGFTLTKSINYYHFEKEGLMISQHISSKDWELIISDCDECGYSIPIKYLHEVQNIFIDLKKEPIIFN